MVRDTISMPKVARGGLAPRVQLIAALASATALSLGGCGTAAPQPPPRSTLPRSQPAPPPAAADTLRWERLEELIAAELAAGQIPSAAIGVVSRELVLWRKGYGARDLEGREPMTTDTLFRIGSLTKLFTGIALLQLRDRGELDLDDPVVKYIPELVRLRSPAGSSSMTLRHLVTHTSGIPHIVPGAIDGQGRSTFMSVGELLARLGDSDLAFDPGAQYEYSNTGMAVAGIVVSRVSNRPYQDYVSHHILRPLGMASTFWDGAVPRRRFALGHESVPFAAPMPSTRTSRLGAYAAAGDLYASLDDMLRFARFALGHRGEGAPVLSARSLAEALRDMPLPGKHGVAWIESTVDGHRVVGHAGAIDGHGASIAVLPDANLAVVVLFGVLRIEEPECVALKVARVVMGDEVGPSCFAPGHLNDEERAQLERLIDQLDRPSADGIAATFDPVFLTVFSPERLMDVFARIRPSIGRCSGYEVEAEDAHMARIVLQCARAPFKAIVSFSTSSPHRINRLQLVP